MPCDMMKTKTEIEQAVERLEKALSAGQVKVVIGRNGAVAFQGDWQADGVADVCAFRRLRAANSWELRQAVARAEALAGRKLDEQTIAAGVHSHDGGVTWNRH